MNVRIPIKIDALLNGRLENSQRGVSPAVIVIAPVNVKNRVSAI